MYSPLLLPLALELGGFVLLALGLAPRRREDDLIPDRDEVASEISDPVAIATPAKPIAKSASGTKNYYQQRLQRDHPAIAKRVAADELSVYAASVAAGIRKSAGESKWSSIDAYVSEKVSA